MEQPVVVIHSQTGQRMQHSIEYETPIWRQLRYFNYFRSILGLSILTLFHNSAMNGFLGNYRPEAFVITAVVFIFSSLAYIYLGINKKLSLEPQVILSNSTDMLLIVLMIHFSGGLGSGLGMLLIINVIATASFLNSKQSFLFAAIASIAILSEQTYSFIQSISSAANFTKAGILGLVFFVSTTLASLLSRRIRETEALVDQRTVDLLNLEKLNEHIIQNMRTGILVVSDDGHIRTANAAAEALIGNQSLKNFPMLHEAFPELHKRFLEWQQQPRMHQKALQQTHGLPDLQPGFRKLSDSNVSSGETLIFLEDATRLNQRFQQIKLASLGRLTASIAHEIRNPLSAINHAAQLLEETEENQENLKLTNIITTQVKRLDSIIQNVLKLSRHDLSAQESIDLAEWIKGFVDEFCLSNKIDRSQIRVALNTDRTRVLFDSSHLYQVINNLCSNAINHSDKNIADIRICFELNFDKQLEQPTLDIIDNGPGIEPDLLEQIFDPFFTTSPKGSGLGLYISKEIVESNRAKLFYVKDHHGGCCFRLQFLTIDD